MSLWWNNVPGLIHEEGLLVWLTVSPEVYLLQFAIAIDAVNELRQLGWAIYLHKWVWTVHSIISPCDW